MLRSHFAGWGLAFILLASAPAAGAQGMCSGDYQTAAPAPSAGEREQTKVEFEHERAAAAEDPSAMIMLDPAVPKLTTIDPGAGRESSGR